MDVAVNRIDDVAVVALSGDIDGSTAPVAQTSILGQLAAGEGVVLDMTRKADGESVEVGDVEAALKAIGYTLKPLDIVLVRTGRDAFYGQPDYVLRGCAVSPESTHWLFDRGVRVMGIDAWGWDGPLDRQAREALARQEPGVFWAAHQCDLAYSQIERLVNLGSLPPVGFQVACFPLKIRGGSAGPAWVVAILPG